MKNNFLNLLDDIVLSKNAVDDFYHYYNGNHNFYDWINKTIPYIERCKNQQQNNPWHKYNVLDHILHSVLEMNKLTSEFSQNDKKILAYAMFFHDMGKPDKHILREKDGILIDSFFDHNIRSAEIVYEVLPRLEFSKNEIDIIAKLVYKHDLFMFTSLQKTENHYLHHLTKELVLKEINDLNEVGDGIKLMRYLILIGRCDNLAQNEKMTAESFKKLDKFDEILNLISNEQKITKYI